MPGEHAHALLAQRLQGLLPQADCPCNFSHSHLAQWRSRPFKALHYLEPCIANLWRMLQFLVGIFGQFVGLLRNAVGGSDDKTCCRSEVTRVYVLCGNRLMDGSLEDIRGVRGIRICRRTH